MKTKTPADALFDKLEYKPTNAIPSEEGIPYVTHEGILKIGEASMRVCVLNTGERVIPKEDLENFFGKDFLNFLPK